MDFSLSPELERLRHRVRQFVDQKILPAEDTILAEDHAGRAEYLLDLQAQARTEGLWTPHLPPEHGGLGLGIIGMCALFREMGRSPVGARIFNCDAPDQGNMDLLLRAGTSEQRARYLRPLCEGRTTSAFLMTEPAPGAGADPSNLRTHATRKGDDWIIDGHKWYATGGRDAAFLILIARTSDDAKEGATMFLIPRDHKGVELVREIPTMAAPMLAHREAEFRLDGVELGPEAVLGGVGQGFRLAQARLVPARLTHCMRWLGLAARALEMCRDYLRHRKSFGKVLAEHQLMQRMVAENARAIHRGNLMTLCSAWMLEGGDQRQAKIYASMAKLEVAQLFCRVLDDAIQMHGALGYSEDLPFSSWYRQARAARIADGPDEVHQIVLARAFLNDELRLLI